MKNLKKILSIFLAIVLLLSSTALLNSESVNAASLKLNKTKITLVAGKSANLKVSGTNKKVKWSTSEKTIVTVSQEGKVTGKNAGTATITAKVGKQSLQCKVTVRATLNRTTATIAKNGSIKLSLKGAIVKSFNSSNKKIATVSKEGKVVAKRKGKATITVVDVNGKKYICKITVEDPSLNKKSVTLQIKQSYRLKLNGNTQKVSWSSSNESVARVDSKGRVTAYSEGNAVITAKVGNKSFKCKITVKSEEIPEITPTPEPSVEPTATPTPNPTETPTPTPTSIPWYPDYPDPMETPTPEPTATPIPEPTATPIPTPTPIYYTIEFDCNGGSEVEKQIVEEGKLIDKPSDPTRSGYIFDGWYLDDEKYDFSIAPTANLTLMASWIIEDTNDNLNDGVIDEGDLQYLQDKGYIEVNYGNNGVAESIDGCFTKDKVHNAEDALNVLNSASSVLGDNFQVRNAQVQINSNNSGKGIENYYRVTPTVNNIPVLGSQVILSAKQDGTVSGLFNNYNSQINSVDTYVNISETDAKNIALNNVMNDSDIVEFINSCLENQSELDYESVKEELEKLFTVDSRLIVYAANHDVSPMLLYEINVAGPTASSAENETKDNINSETEFTDSISSTGESDDFSDGAKDEFLSGNENETIASEESVESEKSDIDTNQISGISESTDFSEEDIKEESNKIQENEDNIITDFTSDDIIQEEEVTSEFSDTPDDTDESKDDGEDYDEEIATSVAPRISKKIYVYANGNNAGNVYLSLNGLESWTSVSVNAYDLLNLSRNLTMNVEEEDNKYRLKDSVRNIETYKTRHSGFFGKTLEALPGDLATSGFLNLINKHAMYSHANMELVYDYYKEILGRTSFDNAGSTIKISYDYYDKQDSQVGARYENAAWLGYPHRQFIIGNAGGYEKGLDVLGHEYTHAVIDYVVGDGFYNSLTYEFESGALNESYADILGSIIEQKSDSGRWLLAEDSNIGAIRSLASPAQYGQPEHYDSRYIGTNDNGGVHTNSGIFNYASYKMMTDQRTTSISQETWAKVYYNSLFTLPTDATFLQGRRAVLYAAKKLGFNQLQQQAIKDAYDAVGIVENDGIRISLTWGEKPRDLDSHLVGPTKDGKGRFHIYYSNKDYIENGDLIADLDYDDTTSYGPEITTIHSLIPGEYYFYVHDYSTGSNSQSTVMGNSGALVKIYRGNSKKASASFSITPGSKGTYWNVCKITISESGEVNIENINTYSASPSYS